MANTNEDDPNNQPGQNTSTNNKLREIISNKGCIKLTQNAQELTVLAFLKKAAVENDIDVNKQSEFLIYYFFVIFVQLGMAGCMLTAIINNHIDYKIYAAAWMSILFCKFVASCALHLILYPEISRSMQLMKYTLNHPEQFTHPTIAFMIPFTTHNINIFAEGLNLF
jgi:hypothetical protein